MLEIDTDWLNVEISKDPYGVFEGALRQSRQ